MDHVQRRYASVFSQLGSRARVRVHIKFASMHEKSNGELRSAEPIRRMQILEKQLSITRHALEWA